MHISWQVRKRIAHPILWVLLVMLCNAFMNADVHPLPPAPATFSHTSIGFDDIDSMAEWLYETLQEENVVWHDLEGEEQDEQSQDPPKVKTGLFCEDRVGTTLRLATPDHVACVPLAMGGVSLGFRVILLPPPDSISC
ncbi:MAG: hypothetical protein MUF29_00595 [Chitinophagaceae bacterium]|nr:hypothetical protein [Chitinophagaceae bacterium]